MTRKGAVSARRIALGACCLLVATVSFVTLTLNLIPAEPVVHDYLGIDYADDMVSRRVRALIDAMDSYLTGMMYAGI